jgi:DNA-binding response OmpR family regulator
VDRRRNTLSRTLREDGNTVIESFTTDQAVALCVSNRIDAVVLDQEFFVEIDGWSVAQSLKLVKPSICVLLVARAKALHDRPPTGVDAMVGRRDVKQVLQAVYDMVGHD